MNPPKNWSTHTPGEPRRVRSDGSKDGEGPPRSDGAATSSAYAQYKQKLHGFFGTGQPLPKELREALDARNASDDETIQADDAAAPASAAPPKAKGPPLRKRPDASGKPSPDDNALRSDVPALTQLFVFHDKLRQISKPAEISGLARAFFSSGGRLGGEWDALSKLLAADDVVVQQRALEQIALTLQTDAPTSGMNLLKTRVESLALLSDDADVRSTCSTVLALLTQRPDQRTSSTEP